MKPGLLAQLRAFDRVYWICIFMELMERLAYYGVRLVVPVYMVLAQSEGGPGLTHTEKGTILASWAAMQSWLPTFAGGFSDRFGYKRTIAVSVLLKTAGYATMAMAGDFWSMLLGTQLLAAGTGLFKPGIQGTMAHSIARSGGADSMGWGLFYQSVNVGAAIGAYVPLFTRDRFGWPSVFWGCSAIVLSNLIPLFFYEDPKDEREVQTDHRGVFELVKESVVDLFTNPVIMAFILISSGFWFTFHQLFDMLPNYVDDWTDSTVLLRDVGGLLGWTDWVAQAERGEMIPQERLLNINALMIMTTMFVFAWLSGKLHVLTSTALGMAIASGATAFFLFDAGVYSILAGVVVFTVGEMLSSPKRQEFMAMLAPPGKRALFLGYANMPDGIGWVLGSLIAGSQYEEKGDKVNLCRRWLAGKVDQADVDSFIQHFSTLEDKARLEATASIVQGLKLPADTAAEAAIQAFAAHPDRAALLPEVLPRAHVLDFAVTAVPQLADGSATTLASLRDTLYATYEPGQVWVPFLGMGAASVILMLIYQRWLAQRQAAA